MNATLPQETGATPGARAALNPQRIRDIEAERAGLQGEAGLARRLLTRGREVLSSRRNPTVRL